MCLIPPPLLNNLKKTDKFYLLSLEHRYYSFYYYFASYLKADRENIEVSKAKEELKIIEGNWMDENNINLNIHPFIAAYLEKGYPSVRLKWYFKHKKWIKIIPRDAYKYLEYHFLDEDGKKIKKNPIKR